MASVISSNEMDLNCFPGEPIPTVTWSRIDGPLPETSTINDVFLVIPQVRMEDAGTYVCTARNIGGSVQQRVNLFVKGLS